MENALPVKLVGQVQLLARVRLKQVARLRKCYKKSSLQHKIQERLGEGANIFGFLRKGDSTKSSSEKQCSRRGLPGLLVDTGCWYIAPPLSESFYYLRASWNSRLTIGPFILEFKASLEDEAYLAGSRSSLANRGFLGLMLATREAAFPESNL